MKNPLIEPLEARIAPAATIAILTPSSITEGDSGQKTLDFTVTLTGTITSDVMVNFTTADGPQLPVMSAAKVSDNDYMATAGTLTFHPGETEQVIHVLVNGDRAREQDERFSVRLDTPTGEGTLGTSSATGTITNDDPVPTVSITDSTLIEGDSGQSIMRFTLTLSNPVNLAAVGVRAVTADDTASAGSDYVAVIDDQNVLPVVFAAGTTTATFDVTIIGDTTFEPAESFFVNLINPVGLTIATPQAHGTITNDDPPPAANLHVADVQVVEGGPGGTKQAVFTVTLSSGPLVGDVTVLAGTANGTADAGTDYTTVASTTLTFHPGETSKQIVVPIIGDADVEASETFFLNLSGVSANAVISRAQATGTIVADDAALHVSDVQILEGGTNGTTQAVFTVTLENGPASGDVTVKVGTADNGSATAGTDYTAITGTTLTFHPGQTSQQFPVPIKGDANTEPNETFLFNLSEPSTNAAIGRGTGMGKILNDDGAVFTINDVTVTEGDSGTSNAVFVVRLLSSQPKPFSVDVTTEAGTAASGGANSDFTPVTTTLTFAAGTTQQTVSVPIHGDLIKESTETFTVRLSNAKDATPATTPPTTPAPVSIAKDAGIGTILDNGDPTPTVSIGGKVQAEGNAGTSQMKFFTATLSQPSDSEVTVAYATHDIANAAHPATAGNDYTLSNGIITFAPGQTSADIFIPVTGDTTNEFDETFGVTLSSPSGAALGTAEGIGTIQNDEVTVSIEGVSLDEGNTGTTAFLFHVTLTTPNGLPVQNNVTINFATVDGTAISTGANKDFTAKQGTLTFTPTTGLSQDISVIVNGDARFEDDQDFLVNLLSSVNATIVDGQEKATGVIQDDDPVTISITDATATEGDSTTVPTDMKFVVSLDHASDLEVKVKVNTQNGTAIASVSTGTPPVVTAPNDFTGITDQTITFAPGDQSEDVIVKIIGDKIDEPKTETFKVVLSDATVGTIAGTGATGTISDNDLLTLSVGDVNVIEGDSGTTTVNFSVNLSGASQQVISFDFATADNTAIAPQDYMESHGTLTIAAGQTTKTVSITVNGDMTAEGNERFLFNLLSSPNAKISATAGQAKATIIDDEAGSARLKLVPVNGTSFTEGNTGNTVAEFRVERTGSLAQAASVQFETVDDTTTSTGSVADYVAKSGTISFAAGSSTASGTIRIAIKGDINYENDEVFQVRLFNPVNAAVLDDADAPVIESFTDVTILDDGDAAPTLSIVDRRIVEGNSGSQQVEFKVRLLSADGLPVANERDVVTVIAKAVDDASSTTPANSTGALTAKVQDYATAERMLTFNKGETEQKIDVTVNGDIRDESDEETFNVVLSGEDNAGVTKRTGVGTIVDDDDKPTLQFLPTTVTAQEGDAGLTNATFTLKLSADSELPISVKVTTKDRTAVSTPGPRQDFVALTDFPVDTYVPGLPGSQAGTFTFTVSIIGDTLNEANESFGLTLSDAQNARLVGASGTGTITNDNDAAPVVAVSDVHLSEGNSGTTDMVFTVSLSAESEQTVSVDFKTADGTGTDKAVSTGAMADFIATSGTLKFAPGVTSQEVHVKINGDTFKEQDEKFSLNLSNAVNGDITVAPSGTGTIVTDGDSTVGITIHDAFVVEGDPTATTNTSTLLFSVELSDAVTTPTTFTAVATNGTALRGSDFKAIGDTVFTIAQGAKTGTVTVTVNEDTSFEATESLFVALRNVQSGGDAITIVGDAGRGTIFNDDLRRVDNQTIQFIDMDGDLATIHVSKGTLSTRSLSFSDANSTVGGRQLQFINFIGNTQFQDADLSVTATRQAGFRGNALGVQGNGHVNVGAIYAAGVQGEILDFVNGIDLGTVTIDGDLGKIVIGDDFVDPAIGSLVVRSMGRLGTATQGTASQDNPLDTRSLVLGPIANLHVFGSFAGRLDLLGAQFGTIRNLQIDGALQGGEAANSGTILFTGQIGNGYIGKIVGGSGASSGVLSGAENGTSYITNLRVGGLVSGGSGANSGVISAPTIKSLTIRGLTGGAGSGDDVTGTNVQKLGSGVVYAGVLEKLIVQKDIVGGTGGDSGQVVGSSGIGTLRVGGEIRGGDGTRSGFIFTRATASNISIFGSVFGGDGDLSGRVQVTGSASQLRTGALVGGNGDDSGTIRVASNVLDLSVFGKIEGGSGDGSGGIDVGGRLLNGLIGGDIVGGNSTTGSLVKSGFVIAHRIQNLDVHGDLKSGTNGGTGLALSGTIRSETTIGALHIRGNVIGRQQTAAIIAAPGTATGAAIQSLIIDGDTRFAEILAGYGVDGTTTNARGTATNSDARIGAVKIGGDVLSSSIIAGVDAGTDGLFGTTDDIAIGGTGTVNAANAVSRIASIVIKGNVLPGAVSSGIEAQHVVAVSVQGVSVPLASNPGNDGAPGSELGLTPGSKIRVFEVPVV